MGVPRQFSMSDCLKRGRWGAEGSVIRMMSGQQRGHVSVMWTTSLSCHSSGRLVTFDSLFVVRTYFAAVVKEWKLN